MVNDDTEGAGRYPAPGMSQVGDVGEGLTLLGQLGHQFQVMFRHKLLILVVTMLGAAGGYYYLQQQEAVFRASTRVMIERTSPNVLPNNNEVVALGTPMFFGTDAMYFQSQYEIIRSTEVAERVLDRLDLWNSAHLLGLDRKGLQLSDEEIREHLAEAHMPTVLAQRIETRPIQKSMLVSIEFEDTDAEFSQTIVNAVAEAYKEQNIAHKRQTVTDAHDKLKGLAGDLRVAFSVSENAVRTYVKAHSVGTIESSKDAIQARLKALHTEMNKESNRISHLASRVESLAPFVKTTTLSGLDQTEILQDPTVRELNRQVFVLRAKLAGLTTRYMAKHPDVQSAKRQLRSLRSSVLQHVRNLAKTAQNDRKAAARTVTDLAAKIALAEREELRVTDIDQAHKELVASRNTAKTEYEDVRKRYQKVSMELQVATNNIRILDPAVSAVQVRPRRLLILGGALVMAFLLALLLAFLVENADVRIRGWADLEERLGLKVLGVLPVIVKEDKKLDPATPRNRDFFMHLNPNSAVAEAYRTLRTNLLFMGTDRPMHTLLVTSAAPSEGKSTVSINTAISIAASGKKVLLVEADMRRPRFAKSFSLESHRGLSTWLVAGGAGEAHIQTSSVEGVDVLVCGPLPPNPAELLHSKRFDAILGEMKESYDTVIFDSPPVLPVSDALSLANRLDGCIVVVRAGRTTRHMVRDCKRQLAAVRAPVLGAVLNHQEQPRRGKYGGNYGVRYGGYGYSGAYGYGPTSVEGDGTS